MIARLTVAVPFAFVVPEGGKYVTYSYEEQGYEIVAGPPGRSDVPLHPDVPQDLEIDDTKAFAANALRFDFHKADFNRQKTSSAVDPPIELMQRVVSSFLARLRYVTRAHHIQHVELTGGATWRIQYLNDDGSELPKDPERTRGRSGRSWHFSLTSLTPAVWDGMHKLPSDWVSPIWDDILLDAAGALPRIGTAVVLAATALEVFATETLDRLAAIGDVPTDVWQWMNARDDWFNDPSTEEQLDVLLKHFTGHSLKEDTKLWQAFKELRTARNKFVHEGTAHIGGSALTVQRAGQLVTSAADIVRKVRTWLPSELQWPQFEVGAQLRLRLPLN